MLSQVGELLKGSKLDAVICVAGGWAGGNAASKGEFKNIIVLCVLIFL